VGFLFASLFKRANGIWYILYTQHGRQRWILTKTTHKTEALKRLRRFDEPPEEQPKHKKLSAFTDQFLTYARVKYARSAAESISLDEFASKGWLS
jgi:hypothetical protein